jgi:medium-chain acyl-[acyl-carrier-protein] hydrolase
MGGAEARIRLFCFAHAGGGAAVYFKWLKAFPPHIAVCPILLPGREGAIDEPLICGTAELFDRLTQALQPVLGRPYALFGYSVGARIAYGLTHWLLRHQLPPPVQLVVAAHRDPARPPHRPGAHMLPDEEFVAYVRDLGGTPDEVLAEVSLARLLIPILRADFRLAEGEVLLEPLPVPITACAGLDDATATPADLLGWGRFTQARFVLRCFEGGHFFIREQMAGLAVAVAADLDSTLSTVAPGSAWPNQSREGVSIPK